MLNEWQERAINELAHKDGARLEVIGIEVKDQIVYLAGEWNALSGAEVKDLKKQGLIEEAPKTDGVYDFAYRLTAKGWLAAEGIHE